VADQVKGYINNLIADATWDAIKRIVGGSLVLSLATAIWEKLKHGSLDWYAIGGIFVLTLLVAASIFRKKVPTSEQSAAQGKPAWKKLQWADAERNRLEGEVLRWKGLYESLDKARDAFSKPPSEVVSGSIFINQAIEVDGKSFQDCKFTNVTFTYNGNGPTEFLRCLFDSSITLESRNPALIEFSQLQKVLRSIPDAQVGRDGPVDAQGHLLSDKFRIGPVPPIFTPLQIETLNLARDLQLFYKTIEPCPVATNWPNTRDGQEEYGEALGEWSVHLGHAYISGGFSDRVTKLVHKLGALRINVDDLERYSKSVGSEENLKDAINALWNLAKRMEKQ
jgi:hypothetical protein